MEILEAYDLAGTLRGAAALAGCDHKTVAHWVRQRELAGGMAATERRRRWAVISRARSMSWWSARTAGSARTSRTPSWWRWAMRGRRERPGDGWLRPSDSGEREHGRRTRPWIPEPGLWMQWDYGDGPVVNGRSDRVVLCVAGVVALPGRGPAQGQDPAVGGDRPGPGVRRFDGVPTYALTDNERTVSVDHVCGIAVRNPQIVRWPAITG